MQQPVMEFPFQPRVAFRVSFPGTQANLFDFPQLVWMLGNTTDTRETSPIRTTPHLFRLDLSSHEAEPCPTVVLHMAKMPHTRSLMGVCMCVPAC